MKLSYCPTYERARKYADAFWAHEIIDRPMLAVTAPKRGMTLPTEGVFQNPRTGYLAAVHEDYEPIFETFEQVAAATYYGGESVPVFDINLGPDVYAGYLGGKLRCVPHSDTTWADPIVEDWEDFRAEIDKSPDGYFEKTRRYIEYAVKRSEGKYITAMMDLHGNMDAMSALRGPEDLCCDLMDDPDAVYAALQRVNDTWGEIYNMIYETSHMAERGCIGWSPLLCTKRFAVLQCDFACMIGPDMFRRFVLPSLEREAAQLDNALYHLDGPDCLKHLDDVLTLKDVDCVQWVPGDGQPRTIEWMDVLKKIQKAGKSVWIYDWTPEEIKARFRELDPALTAFSCTAASQDEAEALEEYLVKNT